MKIAIITNLYHPYTRGGAEKIAKLMAEKLHLKHNVFVITTMPKINKTSYKGYWENTKVNNKKLRIFRFTPFNLFYYLDDYKHNFFVRMLWHIVDVFNVHSYFMVKKILMEEKPDLIISHNLKGIGYLLIKVFALVEAKHIHVLHDVQYAVPSGLLMWNKENSFLANGFLVKAYQNITKKFFLQVNVIISPSQWLLGFYEERSFFRKTKKVVLENPIKIVGSLKKREGKKQYNKLLYVGQIEAHKGLEWFLRMVKDQKYNIDIVGDGSDFAYLKEKFESDNIVFHGKVANEGLKLFYSEADYLVLPSLCYENSPTVIYEAFSNSLPVIASKIGGVPELIDNYKTGYLFEPEDKEHLLSVLSVAKDNDEYCEMSKNCHEKVEGFSTERYVKRLYEVIESIGD